ncbi:MAG: hypothetical protein PHU14_05725 [Methylovulum sp.]|nr:hypothetical protein [Methylovulum sp.]
MQKPKRFGKPLPFFSRVIYIMGIFKPVSLLIRGAKYYLLGSGVAINLAVVGVYGYDPAIFHQVYDKIAEKIILAFNPNALVEEQVRGQQQLDQDIAANFAPWQPLDDGPISVPAHNIMIGNRHYPSLAAASAALQDKQSLLMGEGVYNEALVISQNDVQVIGVGRVVLDGASAEGKAAIITKGRQISISNIECKNIAVADQNGACIRSEGQGLTVNHVYFHDSEQGILSNHNVRLQITDSRFEKLGKNGRAHGIYADGGEVLIDDSWLLAAVSEGHELKSRAARTIVRHCVIASLTARDSRLIDIPNGGELLIEDSVLEKGPESSNDSAIGYGLEGISHTLNSITLKKNVIILERGRFNNLLAQSADKPLPVAGIGNIIVSKDPVAIDGLNWVYASRDEAKLAAYPKLPVLETAPVGLQP